MSPFVGSVRSNVSIEEVDNTCELLLLRVHSKVLEGPPSAVHVKMTSLPFTSVVIVALYGATV